VSSESLGFEVKNKLYTEIIQEASTEFVCCLDIDEFILLPECENIKDFLSSSSYDGFGGIILHQTGTCGFLMFHNGTVFFQTAGVAV